MCMSAAGEVLIPTTWLSENPLNFSEFKEWWHLRGPGMFSLQQNRNLKISFSKVLRDISVQNTDKQHGTGDVW